MDTRKETTIRSRPEAGFTLIEVLIAVVILVFGLVAVMNLFIVAISSTAVANYSTMATTAATARMENLMTLSTDAALPGPTLNTGGNLENDLAGFVGYTDLGDRGRIRTRWVVTQVSGAPLTYHIQVRSEAEGALFMMRTRVDLTTFRTQAPS